MLVELDDDNLLQDVDDNDDELLDETVDEVIIELLDDDEHKLVDEVDETLEHSNSADETEAELIDEADDDDDGDEIVLYEMVVQTMINELVVEADMYYLLCLTGR